MGSPISPSEIASIAEFAYHLYTGCCFVPAEFTLAACEACGMRLVLCMVKIVLDKPGSILNAKTEEGKQLRVEPEAARSTMLGETRRVG